MSDTRHAWATPSFPVVIDHVFKTAGTSIHKYFLDTFGGAFVPEKIGGTYFADLLDYLSAGKVVCAHIQFRPGDDLLISHNYTVTILRDPLERLFSQYRFLRAKINAGSKYHFEATSLSLEQFFFDRGSDSARFHNAYLRHFLQANTLNSPSLSEEGALAQAREVMDRYAVVGIVPKIAEFLCLIATDLGISPPEIVPTENVTPERPDDQKPSQTLIARLQEANAADIALYQYASTLYVRKLHQQLQPRIKFNFPAPEPKVTVEKNLAQTETGAEIISGRIFQVKSFSSIVAIGTDVILVMTYRVRHQHPRINPVFQIRDSAGRMIYQSSLHHHGYQIINPASGEYCVIATFNNRLGAGHYFLDGGLFEGTPFDSDCFCWHDKLYSFESAHTADSDSWMGAVGLETQMYTYPLAQDNPLEIRTLDYQSISGAFGRDVLTSSRNFPPSRTFSFKHEAVHTVAGALRDDGIHTTSVAGCLVFGPYVTVLPGFYRVDFDIKGIDTLPPGEISVDVFSGPDSQLVALQQLEFASGAAKSIHFSLSRVIHLLEIRLFVTAEARAIFKQYHLQHIY